jgi:hypothetical protein
MWGGGGAPPPHDPALISGEWGTTWNFDPQQSSTAIVAAGTTCPIIIHAGYIIGFNLIVDQLSASAIQTDKIYTSLEVLALM